MPPAESLVLRGDQLEPDVPSHQEAAVGLLASAHELYRTGEFGKAENVFHRIETNKKTTPALAEEALFMKPNACVSSGAIPRPPTRTTSS